MKTILKQHLAATLAGATATEDTAALDLIAWGQRFLPHYLTKPPSPLHRWLADELTAAAHDRGRKVALLGPRGAAKSTIATLVYPLRQACEARETYIWLISDTKDQAQTHLNNLRIELAENQALRQTYGAARLTRRGLWAANKIELAAGVIIEAYGTGQRLRGRRRGAQRPSLIICDDIQNDSHIYSALGRATSRDWFNGSLLKAGNEQTNIVNVGTALHREALAVELIQTPGWRTRTFAAIEQWPRRMDLWNEWEAIYTDPKRDDAIGSAHRFYLEHRRKLHDGARVLWPEHEPLEQLMRMRAEEGHISFEREKQNSPIDPERCEFPEHYFRDLFFQPEAKPHIVASALTLDPATGKAGRGRRDYSAWVLVELSADGHLWVDAWLERRPAVHIIERGLSLALTHRPTLIGIEAVAFQELLAGLWNTKAAEAGIPTTPLLIHNNVNKEIRIRRLGAWLSSGRIHFAAGSPGVRETVGQLRDWPIGDHDDGPDALEMAIRLLEHGTASSTPGPSRLPISTQ